MKLIDGIPILKRLSLHWKTARRQRRAKANATRPDHLPANHCLIASFPRSGNTWLSRLIADVLMQRRGLVTQTKLPVNEREIIPDLDRGDLEHCRHVDFAPICLAKTHVPFMQWMNRGVFLLRQPADSLLSYYHFHFRYPERLPLVTAGIHRFCERELVEWYAHAQSFIWAVENSPSRFRIVTYESLLESPAEQLKKVADWLEIPATDAEIQIAVNNNEFAKLNQKDAASGNLKFFRNGKKDSAKNEMTKDLLGRIQSVCGPLYESAVRLAE